MRFLPRFLSSLKYGARIKGIQVSDSFRISLKRWIVVNLLSINIKRIAERAPMSVHFSPPCLRTCVTYVSSLYIPQGGQCSAPLGGTTFNPLHPRTRGSPRFSGYVVRSPSHRRSQGSCKTLLNNGLWDT